MSDKSYFRYALPLLLLIAFILYLPGLHGPFLLDDYSNFVNIPETDSLWQTLKSSALGDGTTTPYRPLSRATLIVNNFLSGTETTYYHKLTNLLIHLFNGITLYVFCSLCFRAVGYKRPALILLITAIWLLHPLQVSTVMYVVQRMAQLASLFTLLALIIYIYARIKDTAGEKLPLVLPIIGISLSSVLALMSKESAALLPLYILAIEYLLFRFKTRNAGNRKRLLLLQSIFVFLPLILALGYFAGHYEQLLNYTSRDFTLSDRLLTESVTVVFYLGQILFPRLSAMGLFLDDFSVYQSVDFVVVASITVLFVLIALVIATRKKHPLIAFGITWFLVSHLLESTVLPLEMAYEHRNYLALFGPVLSVVVFFNVLIERTSQSTMLFKGMAFALLLALSLQTLYRNISWSSEADFAANHLINHPASERTHILLAQIAFKRGKTELALKELEQVSRINPADTSYHVIHVLADCKGMLTQQQIESAVKATATIQHRNSARSVLYAIRKIEFLFATGQCKTISAQDLLRLTSAMVDNPVIRNNSLKHHIHARALAANSMADEAIKYYLQSWREKPQNLQPVLELITLLRDNMRFDESCKVLGEVLQLRVKYSEEDMIAINTLQTDCQPGKKRP